MSDENDVVIGPATDGGCYLIAVIQSSAPSGNRSLLISHGARMLFCQKHVSDQKGEFVG